MNGSTTDIDTGRDIGDTRLVKKMTIHPVAAMFPLIEKGTRDWNDLVQSIQYYGLLEPIVLDGETLLDGRNRLAVCESLEITPRFIQWNTLPRRPEVDQAGWIIIKNLDRRHLTDDQKAMIYTEFLRWDKEQEAAKKKAERQRAGGVARHSSLNPNSDSSSRDISQMNANSTTGKIAAAAKVSRHKAAMAIQVDKAVEKGIAPKELREEVKSEAAPLAKAVQKTEKKSTNPPPTLAERLEKAWTAFVSKFAVCDHEELRKFVSEKLRENAL